MANSRRWYRPRIRTMLLLLLVAAVAWSSYTYWTDYSQRSRQRLRELMAPAEGASCRVVFRGDAIGLDRSGVQPRSVEGTSNYVSGVFVRMNDQWLVLKQPIEGRATQVWIAREQILYLEEDVDP